MNKPWFVVVILLLLEATVILLLIPGDWTKKQIKIEQRYVEQTLGEETREWVKKRANSWYNYAILDSGFYEGALNTLIPTETEKKRSRGMEKMGQDWFAWVEGRLNAFMNAAYQFFSRLALLLAWLPYMLILAIPASYDGLMTWKIKRTNFDYSSPVMHRYAVRGASYLVFGLLAAFMAPIALNPVIIPVALMGTIVLIGLAMGNVQKRI